MAENVARNLSNHYGSLSTSTQRLSSGLRINSSADDAAGLAVRELMRSDITTMNQGVRNCNDAVSMIQTADGGLQVIDEKLTRMKELAEQAATGTYTSDQRLIIDSEYQAMASEITRIAVATDFNGIKLLNENLAWFHDGNSERGVRIHFGTGNMSAEDYYYVGTSWPNQSWWLSDGLGLQAGIENQADRAMEGAKANSYWQLKTDWESATYYGGLVQGSILNRVDTKKNNYISANGQQAWDDLGVRGQQKLEIGWGKDEINSVVSTGDTSDGSLSGAGLSAGVGQVLGQGAASYYGSFAGNTIATQDDAQTALQVIDKASVQVNKNRANLGSTQNRLENTVSNLEIQAENLQSAESQISDTDVATEMTNFVREQILTQAAVAMLSQANSMPKMALQLIQGS